MARKVSELVSVLTDSELVECRREIVALAVALEERAEMLRVVPTTGGIANALAELRVRIEFLTTTAREV